MADPFDERTWQAWPKSEQDMSFHEKLRYGLETNDISNLKVDQLPLAVMQVVKAAERSPRELLGEARIRNTGMLPGMNLTNSVTLGMLPRAPHPQSDPLSA